MQTDETKYRRPLRGGSVWAGSKSRATSAEKPGSKKMKRSSEAMGGRFQTKRRAKKGAARDESPRHKQGDLHQEYPHHGIVIDSRSSKTSAVRKTPTKTCPVSRGLASEVSPAALPLATALTAICKGALHTVLTSLTKTR